MREAWSSLSLDFSRTYVIRFLWDLRQWLPFRARFVVLDHLPFCFWKDFEAVKVLSSHFPDQVELRHSQESGASVGGSCSIS